MASGNRFSFDALLGKLRASRSSRRNPLKRSAAGRGRQLRVESLENRHLLTSVTGITFEKSDELDTVLPGDTIFYSFFVDTSAMEETATGIEIWETVPEGCSLDEASSGYGTIWVQEGAPNTYVCRLGSEVEIHKDDEQGVHFILFDFVVIVDENTTLTSITNTAVFKSAEGDEITATDTDAVVIPQELFELTKDDGLSQVSPGQIITYTIHYSYSSDAEQTAIGVQLAEYLPLDTTYVSSPQDGAWVEGEPGQYLLAVDDLEPGDEGTAYFTVQVADNPTENLVSNTVTIIDAAFNSAFAVDDDVIIGVSELTISKDDSVESVSPGDTLTYTITYANDGEEDATGLYLTETLPDGLLFSLAENDGWSQSGSTLTYIVGTLAANGGSGTATLVLTVADPAPAGDTITNTITITDGGSNTNSASDTDALVAAPAFVISKTDNDDTVAPGDVVVYAIDYQNSSSLGNQDATGVVLTETVPSGATFNDSASTPGWTETPSGSGVYVYTVGDLGSGDGGTVNFAVTINATQAAGQTNIVNTVLIADDGGVTETASDSDTLVAAPDLAVTKTDNLTQVGAGQTLTYTIGYSNVGTQGATGVVLTDELPANLTFSSANNPGWTQSDDTLTYTVGTVAAGATGNVTLQLTVASSAQVDDTITNTVEIADDGTNGADTNPDNNSDTDSDTVGGVNLAIAKTANNNIAIAGQTIVYTITVTNVGAGAAPDVSVSDVLPAGTTFVSATAPSGFAITAPAAGSSGTVTFAADTLAGDSSAVLTLVVQTSPNLANNTLIRNTVTVGCDDNTAISGATLVRMSGVGLRTSSVDPTKNDLIIGGSGSRDVILITGASNNRVSVYMNGTFYGAYTATGRIVVYAHGGSDYVCATSTCTVPLLIDGGDGNDILYAGGGNTVLLGGAGNDILFGGRASSILIGGTGTDMLYGSSGGSILIGGSSVYDAHETALNALLNEWSRDLAYWKRVRHVYDGGATVTPAGLNGTYYFRRSTLIDDNARDYLMGSVGLDFFFTHSSGGGRYDYNSTLAKDVEWLRNY